MARSLRPSGPLFAHSTADMHGGMDSTSQDEGLLDPMTSQRRIYRERTTGIEREIWRPGDGEGDLGTDYFDRAGPPLPLEQCWRLFQSDIGPITTKNQPPRFVVLDDRAVYEVLESEIPRAKLSQNWPHEFSGPGKIRTRRTHRGRPAIQDPNAEGNAKYHSGATGGGKGPYVLSGEPGYQPVLYRYEPPEVKAKKLKRKRMPSPTSEEYNPRGHGHNQYTPRDMLVRNGATSFSLKEKKLALPRPRNLVAAGSNSPTGEASREHSTKISPGKDIPQDTESLGQFDPSEVPPNMGYIERLTFEQKLAARFIACIHTDEDMKKVASELAKAHVKIGQQTHELEHLKTALAPRQEESELKAETRKLKASNVRYEQKRAQQTAEITTLKAEADAGKTREVELQAEIHALRHGQWWHV